MESNKNPNIMPEIKVIDFREILCGAAHFLFDQIRHIGISEHTNRGGGPALDRAIYPEAGE